MSKSRYVNLTEDNFEHEVLKSDQPVLVDFWADWCAPCHRIAPVIEELAHEFDGTATIAKLNVDEEPELARRYGIRSIPSLLFFRSGEAVDRLAGVQPKRVLSEKLAELVAA
ncbi:MAG: thioredoxin [Longimicrobiales bacterium]